jgi:hypothetical protein
MNSNVWPDKRASEAMSGSKFSAKPLTSIITTIVDGLVRETLKGIVE